MLWLAGSSPGGEGCGDTGIPKIDTNLYFGEPDPPTVPHRARGGSTAVNTCTTDQQNRFAPFREQVSTSRGINSEALSSGLLREGSTLVASSSRGIRGREPIPLIPNILHLCWTALSHTKDERKADEALNGEPNGTPNTSRNGGGALIPNGAESSQGN